MPPNRKKMKVTVGIPTKSRYETLVLTLEALAFQTTKDFDVIIVDDTDDPQDIRTLRSYQCVLELFNQYGIGWQVIYGRKLGQHHSHQLIQEQSKTDWIWRIDDDEIPEPRVLEILLREALYHENIGAIGGLVLRPDSPEAPENVGSLISNPDTNVQWFRHPYVKTFDVEHLHSTFLYRRGIEKYNLFLSPAAHREETLFSYGIFRQGYKLLVNTSAVTWHFPAPQGGIRTHHQHHEYWAQDEKIFEEKLAEWGVKSDATKTIVLDSGRGDHVIVKSLLPRLKEKYPKITAATCYRDIFDGEVEQISIAEAYQRYGNLDRFNVYRWCIDHNWTESLVKAYETMWDL